MTDTVLFSVSNNQLIILINDFPHLCLKLDEIIGFQSWISVDNPPMYCIEYYTRQSSVKTEYVSIELWKTILHELVKSVDKFLWEKI